MPKFLATRQTGPPGDAAAFRLTARYNVRQGGADRAAVG